MQFLLGLAIGWFIARNPGVVAGAVQTATGVTATGVSPGGNVGGGLLYAQPAPVYVGPGPAAAPAGGTVAWAGCPAGQGAYQDPTTGRLYCVPVSQLQGFGRWRH